MAVSGLTGLSDRNSWLAGHEGVRRNRLHHHHAGRHDAESNITRAGSADGHVVPDPDPSVADDLGKRALEVQSLADTGTAITKQRLSVQYLGAEVGRHQRQLRHAIYDSQ